MGPLAVLSSPALAILGRRLLGVWLARALSYFGYVAGYYDYWLALFCADSDLSLFAVRALTCVLPCVFALVHCVRFSRHSFRRYSLGFWVLAQARISLWSTKPEQTRLCAPLRDARTQQLHTSDSTFTSFGVIRILIAARGGYL